MLLLILFFLLSITFSFLCSIWEAVLLSISPSYIKMLESERPKLGKKIHLMKEEVDRPLSAILSLNTIAHTVGAIGVGAQAGKVFGNNALSLGAISINGEAIVAAVMTLAILLLSEIIPKTIGANYWKKLTPFTIHSISLLMTLLAPLVWLSQWVTKHLKSDDTQSVLSRSDLAAYAEIGEESGAINSGESRIIANLLKMKTLRAKDIMTPRTVVFMMDQNATAAEYYRNQQASPFSRIPVYNKTRDHVTGIALKDDILQALADDRDDTQLKNLKRESLTISDQTLLPNLFETLLEKKIHLSLVTDEFGSLLGLVTLEDVMETLLGIEIVDETDQAPDLQALARENWSQRAKGLGLLPKDISIDTPRASDDFPDV